MSGKFGACANSVYQAFPPTAEGLGTRLGLAVLIQPRNKFALPTGTYIHGVATKQVNINDTQNNTLFKEKLVALGGTRTHNTLLLPTCVSVAPLYTSSAFDFAVCHTVYNCDCLLKYCRFVFEDQQCLL